VKKFDASQPPAALPEGHYLYHLTPAKLRARLREIVRAVKEAAKAHDESDDPMMRKAWKSLVMSGVEECILIVDLIIQERAEFEVEEVEEIDDRDDDYMR